MAADPLTSSLGRKHLRALGFAVQLFREAPSKRRLIRSIALLGRRGDRRVTSADGTSLSVRRSGEGDPVVMVHGGLAGMGAFSLIEPGIAEHYETWVYDRRGRGGSGDGVDYSLEREIDDLHAVLDAAGRPAHVIAHSFGALIALAAAASGTPMRSLTLYEPPVCQAKLDRGHHQAAEEIIARLTGDDLDQAVATMYIEIAGASDAELATVRGIKPVWSQLRDGVRTIPRELDVVFDVDWDRFDLPVNDRPVLAICGGRKSSVAYPGPEDLPRFVADPEVVTIDGQGHLATGFAPHRFTEAVLDFIDRH